MASETTMRDESTQIAGTARDEVRNVAETAKDQARSAAGRLQDDLRQRAGEEASKFARTLRDASRQLSSMADSSGENQSFAVSAVREIADATDRVASRLDQGGFDSMLADARSWARRNPGGFLLGATVAGFAVGRLVRHLSGNGNRQASGDMRMHDYSPGTSSMYPATGDALTDSTTGVLE